MIIAKKTLVGVCILVITAGVALNAGATNSKAGTKGGQFLKIVVGAKPAALGGAFAAVDGDVNSICWNPAGLGSIKQQQVTFMHNEWLGGVRYEFAGYAKPLSEGRVIAGGITYLGSGNIEGWKDQNTRSDFSAGDMAVTMGYSRKMNEKMLLGANAKLIHQRIDNSAATGIAVDMGILCSGMVKGLMIGASMRNLGSKMKFENKADSLPLEINGGMSFKLPKLLCVMDITIPTDNSLRINTGVEYQLTPRLNLRAGYGSNNDLDHGLSAGIGINIENLRFDYAYVPYGDVDNTHRVSVGKRF
ncbi:PorV/PorQ family protein [Candidatus Desantisbacteria bacterium]|nr:PorV/PorQ family protein [Candidatus Desantisbacteria bacterium]